MMSSTNYIDIVRDLVSMARDIQRNLGEQGDMKCDGAYIDEYCTVKVKGPRGSGHSTAVNDLARLYDAMVVVPKYAEQDLRYKDWHKICSPESIDRVRGIAANVAICDGVDELNEEQKALLYSMSHSSNTFVLVHVG